MITHQVLLRGAAQCYLLQTAMHLVDVVSVPGHTDLQVPVHTSLACGAVQRPPDSVGLWCPDGTWTWG